MLIDDVKGEPADFRKSHKEMRSRRFVLVGDTPLVALHTGDEWQMIRV